MKKHLLYLFTFSMLSGIGMLTACGGGSGPSVANPVATQNTTCVYINGVCTTQNAYQTSYANTNIGFSAQTSNLSGYGIPTVGNLQIQSGFKTMLKEAMGVCDTGYSSGGLAGCDAWYNGQHEISFQLNSSTSSGVRMMIRSMPQYNAYYNYYYNLPSATDFFLGMLGFPVIGSYQGFFNPMILNGTIWPINNNAGFEIRANGPTVSMAWNKLLQLQVVNGKVEDGSFSFKLYYNGYLAATGTMARCQALTCNYIF